MSNKSIKNNVNKTNDIRNMKVLCHVCQKVSETTMAFGGNIKHPDDFYITCRSGHCKNWEEGALPVQNFDIISEE